MPCNPSPLYPTKLALIVGRGDDGYKENCKVNMSNKLYNIHDEHYYNM